MVREDHIRERAHRIWEKEGRPDGRAAQHWERALRELEAEMRAGERQHQSGKTDVEAANIYVHEGPIPSGGYPPGFEPADGLHTPGVAPQPPAHKQRK